MLLQKRWWLILPLALFLWIFLDLKLPSKKDIRQFDPVEIARLDTKMWRSYYDKKKLSLFLQLGTLMRKQFGANFWRSQHIAYCAAKAAFTFQSGSTRADYELALPYLDQYYTQIDKLSRQSFDVSEASLLELEWWIVHRQRDRYGPEDLTIALANSAAILYTVRPESLLNYGEYRTKAMEIRDNNAADQILNEADWVSIEQNLTKAWKALYQDIN